MLYHMEITLSFKHSVHLHPLQVSGRLSVRRLFSTPCTRATQPHHTKVGIIFPPKLPNVVIRTNIVGNYSLYIALPGSNPLCRGASGGGGISKGREREQLVGLAAIAFLCKNREQKRGLLAARALVLVFHPPMLCLCLCSVFGFPFFIIAARLKPNPATHI